MQRCYGRHKASRKIIKLLVVYRFYCMALFHSQTLRHMINRSHQQIHCHCCRCSYSSFKENPKSGASCCHCRHPSQEKPRGPVSTLMTHVIMKALEDCILYSSRRNKLVILLFMQKSKWVWPRNITLPHYRPKLLFCTAYGHMVFNFLLVPVIQIPFNILMFIYNFNGLLDGFWPLFTISFTLDIIGDPDWSLFQSVDVKTVALRASSGVEFNFSSLLYRLAHSQPVCKWQLIMVNLWYIKNFS